MLVVECRTFSIVSERVGTPSGAMTRTDTNHYSPSYRPNRSAFTTVVPTESLVKADEQTN